MALSKTVKVIDWVFRIVVAVILLQTLFFKFSGAKESVYIFSTLGVEPWGRIGSGVVELIVRHRPHNLRHTRRKPHSARVPDQQNRVRALRRRGVQLIVDPEIAVHLERDARGIGASLHERRHTFTEQRRKDFLVGVLSDRIARRQEQSTAADNDAAIRVDVGLQRGNPLLMKLLDFVGRLLALWLARRAAFVLGAGLAAVLMRQTRNSMIEILSADYIRTAWSKGLAGRAVIFRHAFRNGLIPVVTILGLQTGALMGGAVVTEQIFVVPGFGRLIVEAVFTRDYPLVQGVVLVTASTYVLVNLLVDLSYSVLNPRIRIGGAAGGG